MKNISHPQVGFLTLVLFVISSCTGKEKLESEKLLRPVKFSKVVTSKDASTETFSGIAQSSKETKLSFKVAGTISHIGVKVGDQIRRGQLIARIDQTDYSVQLQQSVANKKSVDAQIQSARSQLTNSSSTYERIEKLYENNSVSISEFEQAKSALQSAQAAYDAAVAQANASAKQVEAAQNQVQYSTLTAPYEGIITSLQVEENEIVGAGAPIATISALGDPEISVGMPEIYISKVSRDQEVKVQFSSISNKTFDGYVYEVGFSSLGGSTYPVTIRITKPTVEIRPGMPADVHFTFANDSEMGESLIAPVAAVGEDGDGHFVYTLINQGEFYRAKRTSVEIGDLSPAGFEVKSGLTAGDLVAVAGLDMLLDEMQVKLLE